MTDIVERLPLVCEAITEEYGEECAMFDPECWTCKVWAELRLSLSEARATGRREGLSEAAAIAEQPITYRFDDGSPAMTRPLPYGEAIAAAIRAAMEKAE